MLTIPEKIALTLESLGSTSAEVADSIRGKGIKGYVGVGSSCPVARVLQQDVPETAGQWGVFGYWVGDRGVALLDTDDDGLPVEVPLPAAVVDFVQDFDRAVYPSLLAEEKK